MAVSLVLCAEFSCTASQHVAVLLVLAVCPCAALQLAWRPPPPRCARGGGCKKPPPSHTFIASRAMQAIWSLVHHHDHSPPHCLMPSPRWKLAITSRENWSEAAPILRQVGWVWAQAGWCVARLRGCGRMDAHMSM